MTEPQDLHSFEAVTFEASPGRFSTIGSIEQASGYLERNWPLETGSRYWSARDACASAIAGKLPCERARAEFIAALGEIGITPSIQD